MQKNENGDQKKRTRGTVITVVVVTVALVLFVFSALNMFDLRFSDFANNASYRDLAVKNFEQSKDSPEKLQEMFRILKEGNPDTAAWLDIPGTTISYPILFGAGNDHYETHNFFGEENRGGAVFLDERSDLWAPNVVIFAQNMTDGSMFAPLKDYQDKSFFDEHQAIMIYLPDGTVKQYQVFAAYTASDGGSSFQNAFQSEEEFQKYLQAMQALSKNDPSALPAGNAMLTLATVEKGEDTAKYVVQAVLR